MSDAKLSIIERGDEINVISLFAVLWRYKLVILACGLVFGLVAVYLALTARFVYAAEVVVTPVTENQQGGMNALAGRLGGLASLAGVNLPGGGAPQEALAVLRSRHLAETFIDRNDLTATILGKTPRQSLWLAVDKFRGTVLSIRQEKESGTTVVSIQWSDPKIAAAWANQYVALANEILRNRALADSTRNIKFLNEQISKTQVVEIQRVMFSLIENETKNHMLASTRSEYAFTVVDPAVTPEQRVWPRRGLMVLTGGAMGGFFGGILALGINFWRQHRKSIAA